MHKTAEYLHLDNEWLQLQSLCNWSEIMRQKLTACTVLCLLGCILQASVNDRLDFSGSCHFLCTLFSLTFSLWPPCYTTCGVRESPPSRMRLRNPRPPVLILVLHSILPFPWPQRSPSTEIVLSTPHPLLFPPPFHLISSWIPPSIFSREACKNACKFQLFVLVHRYTNAWTSVCCQSDEVCDAREPIRNKHAYIYKLQSFALQSCPVYEFLWLGRSKHCGTVDSHILP